MIFSDKWERLKLGQVRRNFGRVLCMISSVIILGYLSRDLKLKATSYRGCTHCGRLFFPKKIGQKRKVADFRPQRVIGGRFFFSNLDAFFKFFNDHFRLIFNWYQIEINDNGISTP